MKQKIISALFLSGTMLVSNFAFAESSSGNCNDNNSD